jgi:hypothetical protein
MAKIGAFVGFVYFMQSTNSASRGANYSRRFSTSGYRTCAYEAHTLGPNTSSVDPDSFTEANTNASPNTSSNASPDVSPNASSDAIPNANANANAIANPDAIPNADTRS